MLNKILTMQPGKYSKFNECQWIWCKTTLNYFQSKGSSAGQPPHAAQTHGSACLTEATLTFNTCLCENSPKVFSEPESCIMVALSDSLLKWLAPASLSLSVVHSFVFCSYHYCLKWWKKTLIFMKCIIILSIFHNILNFTVGFLFIIKFCHSVCVFPVEEITGSNMWGFT